MSDQTMRDPMRHGTPLLRVTGVSKSFPGVKALQDMRLDLFPGEVLALVGENGAGKSTLMKLLSGIHQPDQGTLEVGGRPARFDTAKQAQDAGIAIIHQEFNLMNDLTVAQNVFIGREPRRAGFFLRERDLNRTAQDLFDRLGMTLDPRRLVGDLPVAAQQMVEIAKALSTDARILILDEPTAALNDAEVDVLHGLIRRFVTGTTAAIYISHRMDELKRISQRIQVIRDGRYVDTLPTATTTVPEVINRMVGREIADQRRPAPPRGDREVVLSVHGLSTKSLLKDVGFELRRGEVLGFAGLMGAGRTEVARALVGADRTTAGTVSLHGRVVRIKTPADAAKLGLGYLSEDRKRLGLLLEDTVSDNIVLSSVSDKFQRWGFVDRRTQRAVAGDMVGKLRVKTPSTAARVKNLSGGNQQKVVIAKWLVKDCDVLIFDEPTRGIDVGAKEEIHRLLDELAASGKSIIVISSELPEVLRLAHRIVVMCEGRITGEVSSAEATQENIMHLATLRPTGTGTAVLTGPPTPQES